MSLTDSTEQDQEKTITEEDPVLEDKLPHRERGTGQTGQETQVTVYEYHKSVLPLICT